ncbi:hypothetical protein HHK36_017408 [Tetracentron sinense]|uniref:Non-haem dioxygenase N-terminal domain-containing protein n=1 Tax=Tetracentron sinense TaxID=13715 RepID=A0A835DFQ5_TETSI|nr:hypothetical protein HHK36_017408 [Tetracentron sinense]
MAEELMNLEWSLLVPSVQELVSQRLEKVPRRYIKEDVEDPITNRSDPFLRIPLVDRTKLVNPDTRDTELHKLQYASKDWGVFQLINHGASDEVLRNMKKQNQDFFNHPLQEKKQYAQKPASIEGYGQAFVISEDQQLEWCDMIFLKALPIHNRMLHFWPQHPQEFRVTLERYAEEIMSNGIHRAPDHIAVVNKWKEKLSVVTFCYPGENAEIGPASKLIKSEGRALYKTLTSAEYFHRFYNQKLGGDRSIDTLKNRMP